MAKLLKGAPVAKTLSEQVKDRVSRLKAKGVKPTLAIVRVGEQGSDIAYERGVVKRCEKIGVAVKHFILPANCSQQKLLDVIHEINADADVQGCLLFRPLPGHMNEHEVCEALAPDKDIDCITSGSLSGVFTGNGKGFSPCTAQACLEILSYYGYDPKGKRVTVIGRSLVIGRPVSMMPLRSDATDTVCHTKTKD
ncbi:MAG: bifunctional 5,10-methylenetetrahydrofolate dehydrogenase/5,10-methenyltetrahydrofolate cyclohydrolase, partial [Firmicutes bacterium]|nr:bifunctional 5,10-methylenetetrahydrofolate dehydrogenase/5,10-methenyltetrahydrofolate cyclohydrolase [Bacillota bacterium]